MNPRTPSRPPFWRTAAIATGVIAVILPTLAFVGGRIGAVAAVAFAMLVLIGACAAAGYHAPTDRHIMSFPILASAAGIIALAGLVSILSRNRAGPLTFLAALSLLTLTVGPPGFFATIASSALASILPGARSRRPIGASLCEWCGYDRRGLTRCPECGR
jgi:hypothetical protein